MIQRIQSLYLAIALILMGLLNWFTLAEIAVGDKVYAFMMKGVVDMQNDQTTVTTWPLLIFFFIIIILQLFIILSYKNRVRQMRLTTFNSILMIGFVLVSWLFVRSSLSTLGEGIYTLKLPLIFPVISAILNYLAIRAIAKDELLVRSVDRIR